MTTTTSVLTPPIRESFSYKLLSVPVPFFIHRIPATRRRMARNAGQVLRMRRYRPLDTATVPLGNSGVTPPPQQLTAINIDAQIEFYGTYISLNEQVTLTSQDPVLNEAAKRLGVSLRETEDQLVERLLRSTASRINCVSGTNGQNPTEITRSDINEAIRALVSSNGHTFVDKIPGELRFGTAPIRDSYLCLASTRIIGDLEAVEGFIEKSQYPAPNQALASEWGSVSNTRWLLSSVGSVSESASDGGMDVLNCFVCAQEGFTIVEQDGYTAEFIYRPAIYDSPLALNAQVGYKFAEASAITNDQWVLNLRCTTT